eukprot:CAMPEP_0197457962 /NCGR_PEP_ID=MMETSP1175-20131217/47445_1 /TAXON_ID=1003142 /ORGANISM="Triceratium dubium, Strain CCMP147" /LENGTH=108 /DNA_ID=CAMNT_0042992465 /DNA_START=117 /DNA_END=443 /DNA_ORIENTATION=+
MKSLEGEGKEEKDNVVGEEESRQAAARLARATYSDEGAPREGWWHGPRHLEQNEQKRRYGGGLAKEEGRGEEEWGRVATALYSLVGERRDTRCERENRGGKGSAGSKG